MILINNYIKSSIWFSASYTHFLKHPCIFLFKKVSFPLITVQATHKLFLFQLHKPYLAVCLCYNEQVMLRLHLTRLYSTSAKSECVDELNFALVYSMEHASASFTTREQEGHSQVNLTVLVELGQGWLPVMHHKLLRDWVTDHDIAVGHHH